MFWFSPVHSGESVSLICHPNEIIAVSDSGQLFYKIYIHDTINSNEGLTLQDHNSQLQLPCTDLPYLALEKILKSYEYQYLYFL